MKKVALLFCAVLCMSFVLGGCVGAIKHRSDDVVQIVYEKLGYGDEWIREAVKLFNEEFSDKGMSAVIEESGGTVSDQFPQQIKTGEANPIDLYILADAKIALIEDSYSVLKHSNFTLYEDLSEGVFDKPAIGLDGAEESEKIVNKMTDMQVMFSKYLADPNSKWYDKQFFYQWVSGPSGMVVNEEVLKSYGFNDIPYTTSEMKVMFDKIKATSSTTKVYPVTWGGQNAAGYWQYVCETWFAQYSGAQTFIDFYRFNPKTGTTQSNGYDVYSDQGLLNSYKELETFVDLNYAAAGTLATSSHLDAQALVLMSKAAFGVTGDWMYNEMKKEYSNELKNIRMLPVPVTSEIGRKLNLSADAEACDKILSLAVKSVDEDKTDAEIISIVKSQYSVDLTESQVVEIREARGIYFDLGSRHTAIIPSLSNGKESAKTFLRFISSEDFQPIFSEKSNSNMPFNSNLLDTDDKFKKSISKITNSSYSNGICEAPHFSNIRSMAGVQAVSSVGSWVTLIKGMSEKRPAYTAQKVYDDNYTNVSGNNWKAILDAAGFIN